VSQYTTGEVAKLCGVTVRTVQYYDTRGILTPSALTEGGRRLYDEEDVRKCRVICFLRELDLPIDAIRQLLSEEDPGSVISILLDQQEQVLREEIEGRRQKLERLEDLRRGLRGLGRFSIESIGDIANIVENRKKLKRLHRNLFFFGLPSSILQWATILLWIFKGIWWPFALWAVIAVPYGVWISRYYFRNTAYICPQCHTVFKPTFRQAFFARHTPKTRKLTCVKCGHHGFCVETWGGE